jgi:hypothetical protein
MKICPHCRREKTESDFPKNKNRRGGIGTYCRICQNYKTSVSAKKLKEKVKEIPAFKICAKCKENKSSADFGRSKYTSDSLFCYCKKCINENTRIHRNRMKNRPKETPPSKVCPRCKKDKASSEFGRCATIQDGLAAYCKECFRIKQQEWRLNQKFATKRVLKEMKCPGCHEVKKASAFWKDG